MKKKSKISLLYIYFYNFIIIYNKFNIVLKKDKFKM